MGGEQMRFQQHDIEYKLVLHITKSPEKIERVRKHRVKILYVQDVRIFSTLVREDMYIVCVLINIRIRLVPA